MKKIFYIFLSRPITTLMFYFSVLIIGVVSLINLPIELTPRIEYPSLSVSVAWPGVSPEAVEAYLTSPIESELATVTGVRKISSTSSSGISIISIDFHPKTDINFARIEINEKLASLRSILPTGVYTLRISPYIPKEFQNLQGFLSYSFSSNHSANEVRKYIKENVLVPLKAIDGVSTAEISGGSDRLIEIIVDYSKIHAFNISNEEISKAVGESEVIVPSGKIQRGYEQVFLKVNNEVNNPTEIKEQVVKILPNSQAIRIKDIAKIIDDFERPTNYYRINGKETVTINITKAPGANTLAIAKAVDNEIMNLAKKFPPDFSFIKEIDKSKEIFKDLDELYRDGLFSVIIIFFVILVIFRNIRYPFIILISLIFSFLFSFILFLVFNLSLNIITIASFIIGFGFKIDNSIVVLDYLDKHYDGRGTKRLAVNIKEIFAPLFFSTFSIISVFIPLIFLTGELKLYFEQFVFGIGSTLLASLIVSFTVVPLLFKNTYHNVLKGTTCIQLAVPGIRFYSFILNKIFKWKKLSIVFLILIVGLPVWLMPNRLDIPIIGAAYNSIFDSETYQNVKPYVNYLFGGTLNVFFNHVSHGELWQYGEETYIYVRLDLPNGNRIDRIDKLSKDLENEILAYRKNIKTLIANVVDEETATLKIEFTSEQSNSVFPYILKNYITAYITRLGGVDSYIYGFGPGFSNSGSSSSSMFNVIVKGFNYEKVKSLAEQFRDKIKRYSRIDNVDIDKSAFYWSKDTYEIIAKINRDKLAAYNISIDQLFSILAKNTGGNLDYRRFRINNEEVDYRIKFSNYNEIQLTDLENMIVNEHEKEKLKIRDVLTFEEQKVLSSINREDQQYVRNISFEFKGPYKYGNKFLEASIASTQVPEGYSIKPAEFSFIFSEKEETDILKVFGAAILVIIMISSSLFESLKKPVIIITAIPFALVGSVLLFWIFNYNIERGAYAGMLLLLGLCVSNSIVLVNYLSTNCKSFSKDEIIFLSRARLRAILTTTTTTFAALIPFILSNESAFWKNLSLSIAGGIVISALYVVFFMPMIFKLFSKKTIL